MVGAHVQNADKETSLSALKWNSPGQMGVETPRETWRRMIEWEMTEVGQIWNELRK